MYTYIHTHTYTYTYTYTHTHTYTYAYIYLHVHTYDDSNIGLLHDRRAGALQGQRAQAACARVRPLHYTILYYIT